MNTISIIMPIMLIIIMEVEKQMKKMQNNKACGPDGVPTESLRPNAYLWSDERCIRKRHTNSLEDEHFDHLV